MDAGKNPLKREAVRNNGLPGVQRVSGQRLVSLKDVAEAAGVSAMTVSRVLRGAPQVKEATAAAVRAAVDSLGYRRDPLLSALSARRGGRSGPSDHYVIPFVTNWAQRDGWRQVAHFRLQFEGAKRRGEEIGYRVEPFWLREPGVSHARFSSILYNRGIRGMLIAPSETATGHLRIEWQNFAAVKFGYSLRRPSLHYVADHQFHTMLLICRELWRLGYRRPGLFLHRGGDTRSMHQWTAAFYYDQRKHLPADRLPPLLVPGRLNEAEEEFRVWFKKHRPDVVISLDAILMAWLGRLHRAVPADVGFAHLDLPSLQSEWSGVYQHPEEIGAQAVDLLEMLIRRHEFGVPERAAGFLSFGSWVPGRTVRRQGGSMLKLTKTRICADNVNT